MLALLLLNTLLILHLLLGIERLLLRVLLLIALLLLIQALCIDLLLAAGRTELLALLIELLPLQIGLRCLFALLLKLPLLVKLLPLLISLRALLRLLQPLLLCELLVLFRRAVRNSVLNSSLPLIIEASSWCLAGLRNGNVAVGLQCVRGKQHLRAAIVCVEELLPVRGGCLPVSYLHLHGCRALLPQCSKFLGRGCSVQTSISTVVACT